MRWMMVLGTDRFVGGGRFFGVMVGPEKAQPCPYSMLRMQRNPDGAKSASPKE